MIEIRRGLAAAALLLFTAAGCGEQNEAEASADDPETLGVVAAHLQVGSDRSDEILEEHGMTRSEFEERVWEVAEDPEASERYTRAMEDEMERLEEDSEGAER